MMRPTTRALRLAGLLALLALLALPLWPWQTAPALTLWSGALLAILLALLLEALAVRQRPKPSVTRQLPAALSVRQPHEVLLRISGGVPGSAIELADQHPGDDPHCGFPVTIVSGETAEMQVRYLYTPSRRGEVRFGDIKLWRQGPLGLLWQQCTITAAVSIPVFPDFSALQQPALTAQAARRGDAGKHRQPRRGEGMEFHRLREYREGDAIRQIDWKASARRNVLISREYQEEENQHVILLLDGGSRLAMRAGELFAFDHALHAALMLSWSALQHGDKPGLLLFSNEAERWQPPLRGSSAIHRLLHAVYDLYPGEHASDYTRVAQTLQKYWQKHSLVVLLSHLQPDDEPELMNMIKLLRQRHLLLIADIQLPEQQALRQRQTVTDANTAFRLCADADWQQQQQRLIARLRHAGALIVQATPQQLPAQLNSRYLELKRAGRL